MQIIHQHFFVFCSYTATVSSTSTTTLQHQYKTASLGSLPTTSTLASGNLGNEKNENFSNVENLPKSKLVQEQQNHYNEREKGDVLLSEEQPSFVVCASSTNMMQTLNDKCVKNALTCSESRDQDDNNSSVTGKADSSEFSVQYPSNNLKHDLVCDDIPLMIFEKGKFQNHNVNFSINFINIS